MKTMRDVAVRANVSATTVSVVLNGRQPLNGGISEETRQRVFEAAKELGYRRNAVVQAVISGNTRTLGFLARGVEQEFMARVTAGVLDETEAAGYSLQTLRLPDHNLSRSVVDKCLEMRLAGIITVDLDQEALDHLLGEMRPLNVPVAFLDTSYNRDWGIHVATDDAMGCRQVLRHLTELGHRRIGFIGGEPGRGMAEVREKEYRSAMAEFGLDIPEGYVQCGHWHLLESQRAATEMLGLANRPTAIFCANDGMALGVQRAGRRLGLEMPRDLSVVGFSDSTAASLGDPFLTTVSQPVAEMGRIAARLVVARLTQPETTSAQEVLLPTQLVVRESTAPPPN
jgi:DNA-binding LacI/PurR family transcriptional regulator